MTNLKTTRLNVVTVGMLAFSGLAASLAPVTASAAVVSGIATITIDNVAMIAASAIDAHVEKHWGPTDNNLAIDRNATGGVSLPLDGSYAMDFTVNSNGVTEFCGSCGQYGRSLQATTMDNSNTASGQIGLSGAWRINSLLGIATPYDFSLSKTSGTWNIQTFDTGFQSQNFLKLVNVSESLNANGELLLSGDLQVTGLWALLTQMNTSAIVGSIHLAPAPVPVPAAVWMFGSGLLGLLGVARKKATAAA